VASVGELLASGMERLRAAGSESPRLDAEVLLGHAIGVDRTAVIAHPESPVGPDAAARYESSIERRSAGEPVAYIRGVKEFYGLAFVADPRALIPRPETERLVELAGREVMRRLTASPRGRNDPPFRIVDVGTGSGAVAVALGAELRRRGAWNDVEILATDADPDALDLARENAVGHALADRTRFLEADLLPEGLAFDLVVANLPYVRSDAIEGLAVAASFEPRAALDGGHDGLEVIRRLVAQLADGLARDGVALLEIGADQGAAAPEAVAELLPDWLVTVERDLAGQPRVMRIERQGDGRVARPHGGDAPPDRA
jgi:release factor glutamine methyltransferase